MKLANIGGGEVRTRNMVRWSLQCLLGRFQFLFFATSTFSAISMFGCSPITTIQQDGSVVKHFLGYVRVIEPPTRGAKEPFFVYEVEGIGLNTSKGLGLGYFHERTESVPLDCRLVIRVMDRQQLDRVFKVLSKTKIIEEGLCATVSP